MKRNQYGVNFDLGVPLESEWEFQNLFVSVQKDLQISLERWLERGDSAFFIGGQIGSGKSTIIQKVIQTSQAKPEVEFHFDREGSNLTLSDFWRIILAGLIGKALHLKADLSSLSLPEEFAGLDSQQWQELLTILNPPHISQLLYLKRKKIQDKIQELPGFIEDACTHLLNRIEEKLAKKPLLFAAGIDKYAPDSAAFFDLRGPLEFLMSHKTLFELNIVHMFHYPFYADSDRWHIIYAMRKDKINDLLKKRMGIYSKSGEKFVSVASRWSGGNPRQALRMFMTLQKTRGKTLEENTVKAIKTLFLEYFAYSPKPEDQLLNAINHQNYLEPTILSLPGDKETAQRAVYGNWVLLQRSGGSDGTLKAIINPIVRYSVDLKVNPDDPEVKLLKRYATQKQMSSVGLDFNRDIMLPELWKRLLKTELEQPPRSNLVEIIEILKSSLLSKDRTDRIIIAYRQHDILEAARSYIFTQANTFEYQSFKHTAIQDNSEIPPSVKLIELVNENVDIISVDFLGDEWTEKSLIEIDKIRDSLLGHQMIWWIHEQSLSKALHYWTQIRQLFQIFVLEDELLASLSRDEVKSDIAFFESLVEGKNSDNAIILNNLGIVLRYLDQTKEEGNG